MSEMCSAPGCKKLRGYGRRLYCEAHYYRLRRGKPLGADLVISRVYTGLSGGPEYRAWTQMWQRCTNEKLWSYKYYGGRGLKICERWQSFSNFFTDMGQRPARGLSLDRINNDDGYSPENCRWADATTQSNNRRKTREERAGTASK